MKTSKKTLLTFSLASFLNDVGAHIVKPLWPAFITIFLGAPAYFLGLIDGLGQATSAITRYPSGKYADTKNKKPLIWIGYLLPGLARLGYAISTLPAMLLPFHILDRTGKGIREPPRDTLLSEKYKKNRGGAFGFMEAMDHLGAAIGPIIGFALFTVLSYRYTFAIAAIPSIVSSIIIYKIIKEKKLAKKAPKRSIKFKDYPKNFKILTACSGIFALAWFSVSFFILRAIEVGISTKILPIFYLFYILPAAASTYIFGKLSDRMGRKSIIILAYTMFAVSCAGFMLATSIWVLFAVFMLFGVHYGILQTVPKSFVSDIIKEKNRPSALGIYEMIFELVSLPASIIAGLLWTFASSTAAFGYGLAISVISTVIFAVFVKE